MKIHGDSGWESFPSYLGTLVPRVLDMFKECNLEITFFIVGQDAAIESNRAALRSIAAAGHELGNHSYSHEPWFHLYGEPETEREIVAAEEHIMQIAQARPVGFRGPGFSVSECALRVLTQRGYIYDASTFPTFIGPLARAYYFMVSSMTRDELRKRKALFGHFTEGLRPLHAYRWKSPGVDLLEIPVTTMPMSRLPIHMSYILYLSGFSRMLALAYFRTAILLCRAASVSPSLLLHPLDFLDRSDAPELVFFPGMQLPANYKIEIVGKVLQILQQIYTVVSMRQYASQFCIDASVPVQVPDLARSAATR
jgi:hypothetical protein